MGITPIPPLNLTKFWVRTEFWARADWAMATMTKTTPPTASVIPKKERGLIARFGGLGFDIDVVNNNAESLIMGFMIGGSHRCRIMAD
ncbi:MAG TPA: hypothetical protein VK475_07570 [Pyrinomonadaceae bacterium]|nr:hypothetical protein [Pyrinomonadaceae bacterium]